MLPAWPFLLILILFSVDAMAQNNSDSGTNFQPSLAVVIGMLSIMFSLTFFLLLYAKFCHRRTSTSVRSLTHQIQDSLIRSRSRSSGLDKTVVESLPFFRFSSLRGSRDGLECSICLNRFQDVEILRLLPKCKHAFHIDCIDQWLEKHSTCPLCRHKVAAQDLSAGFPWNDSRQESNLELYVHREESNRRGSSRFSIRSKEEEEETLPIPQNTDSEMAKKPLHKHNHRIVISDLVLKHRWSNVSSSDLIFLNSEMLADASDSRFSTATAKAAEMDLNIDNYENQSKYLNHNEQRSMSEIIVHQRSKDPCVGQRNVKEERARRIWLPIAKKTAQWFADRERVRRQPAGSGSGSGSGSTSIV